MSEYPKPKTISELLEFCSLHNMPLRQMRFFIGEDYPEPRAFGIFRAPDGDFVVYKNKDDGSRAVRYKGPDEAFAVNEIYEKLKTETELRKNLKGQTGYNVSRSAGSDAAQSRRKRLSTTDIVIIIMLIICIFIAVRACRSPDRGYYRSNDRYYYYDTDDWYYYDDGWYILEDDDWLNDNYQDYYISDDYVSGYDADDFRNSEYYNGYYERSDNDYDYDNDDYDWGGNNDYGDWNAGDTDWGTDW